MAPRKHSICTHFPNDPKLRSLQTNHNYQELLAQGELANQYFEQRGLVILITADHKAFHEGAESRHNHRYSAVVQDLAAQWIQLDPCKTKNSQETEKSLRKFLEPSEKPKVIYTDNSLEFGRSCEELSWNHCSSTPTPHRSETNGIAERAVRISTPL